MAGTEIQGAAPYEIKIDKEGVWYYNGAEMFRKDILAVFFENLHRDESGRYYVRMGSDMSYLNVEDTPIVVKSVYEIDDPENPEDGRKAIGIFLSDSSLEKADLESLRMGKDNVLYCSLQRGFPARFTRAAYYQIAEKIQFDENEGYFIPSNGKKYFITEESEGNNAG
jgi:hypothetical protein